MHTVATMTTTTTTRRRPLGLSVPVLFALAALGVPRVILHDLHLIEGAGPVTWLLALGPVAVWIAVALLQRVPNPFLTVLVIGVLFGVLLAATHQVLWQEAFAGTPPTLGDGATATLLPRIAAIPSGIAVGTAMGAVGGLIAHVLRRATATPEQSGTR